jgi:hypothetical protein
VSQHYTLNTVEVSSWCKVCRANTMHKVQHRLVGACLVCLVRPTKPAPATPAQPESGELFCRGERFDPEAP